MNLLREPEASAEFPVSELYCYKEGDLEGDLKGILEGNSKGDFRGDFKQDLSGSGPGPGQVWFSLQLNPDSSRQVQAHY